MNASPHDIFAEFLPRRPHPLDSIATLLSACGDSVRTGRVTPGEARLLKREALKVADAAAALISDCDAVLAPANDERGAP